MKEAITLRRKVHTRYTSSNSTTRGEEYDIDRKKVKELAEEKKGILWKDEVNETNEDFDGGMKNIWGGMKRDTGQASRSGRHGNSYSFF